MRVFCKNNFPPKLWDENLITLKVKICHWKYGKKEKEFGISHVKLNNSLQYVQKMQIFGANKGWTEEPNSPNTITVAVWQTVTVQVIFDTFLRFPTLNYSQKNCYKSLVNLKNSVQCFYLYLLRSRIQGIFITMKMTVSTS